MRRLLITGLTIVAGLAAGAETRTPTEPAMPASTIRTLPPEMLLRETTLMVTNRLRQEGSLQTNSPARISELVTTVILPLFDLRHMTRLALARHWRLASPEQKDALIAEFKNLLLRSYVIALTNYRDQVIEYKRLPVPSDKTRVTIRSSMMPPGINHMTIDYTLNKTADGWQVYDIDIDGISQITGYRSLCNEIIGTEGMAGLIRFIAARSRPTDSSLGSLESGSQELLFMYIVVPGMLRSR